MSDRQQEIRQRLGTVRFGTGPESRTLADATAGEPLVAVVGAMWNRHGWLAAATPTALHLARQPRMFGRREQLRLEWSALRDVRTGPTRIDFAFDGGPQVELTFAGPNEELTALTAFLRGRDGDEGEAGTTLEELYELARRKLGRTLAFGYEHAMDPIVGRLGAGERVERIAVASLDFGGVLVLTDRRLLLYGAAVRRSREREWEVDRPSVVDAAAEAGELVLHLADGTRTRLTDVLPPERADELAAVLARRGGEAGT